MAQKDKPAQQTNWRSVRRCHLVASAEVTDLGSGTILSARISELSVVGCYVDALTPFPEGTSVKLRILRDQGVFECDAKVVRCDPNYGMGVSFTAAAPDQRSVLEAWLAEIVNQLRPVS
jgi:hypothetical protein